MHYYSYEVTTTQRCDMACTYCFEGEELQNKTPQRHSADIIRSVYELLNSKKFTNIYDGVTLNFWGGEPTLNPKMIIELINEFKDSNVNFFLYTNGYNINNLEKIINNFKLFINDSTRFTYQISYDGLFHDKERIDHQGKGTSEIILENIRCMCKNYPEFELQLKSTLIIDDILDLESNWLHFKDIKNEFPQFSYSPTLEYTNRYDITPEFLEKANTVFLKIAKLEIEYYKINNSFVWGWFGVGEHVVCSAGASIANVDIDGNILVCHGAMYSPNKEKFILGNIKDDMSDVIMKSYSKHNPILEVPDKCKGCEATVCYQCPIINYDNSDKETYEEKFHDPKDDLCGIYQSFGRISRTVQKYLGELNG